MFKTRWLLALPLVLAASLTPARASAVRDNAGLFSAEAVSQAQSALDRVEREYRVPVTVETIDSLDGRSIDAVLPERAKASGAKGIFVLISKNPKKIEVERSGDFARAFPQVRIKEIIKSFKAGLDKGPDAGLKTGVEGIQTAAAAARSEMGGPVRHAAPVPARGFPRAQPAPRGSFGLGSLLGIGLIIVAVLIGIRLLGALFSGNRGGYAGRPGMGPGYGGPGYGGGGGGGFMSSLFGGIGGALAGNWLYDQFSGRHHGGYADQTGSGAPDQGIESTPESTEWGGGDGGADWGGGNDAGGGGGGDWGGGGGGDWGGGGGGDWGGGGGGDW